MPKVSIDHSSSIPADQAISTIKKFFESDKDLQGIDSKIKGQFNPGELKGKITGSQFKADVEVKPEGKGSKVHIVVDLPLLLTPFKSKIEEMLKKKLSQHLA